MNHLVIGIPTYKRKDLLEILIRSIYACEIDKKIIKKIDVVIVDNDKSMSAKEIVKILSEEVPDLLTLNYFHNSSKGLCHVRNEILKQAYKLNPDYLVCVDDDEQVVKEWLNQLTKTIIDNRGDICIGPVFPKFKNKTPDYISKWFWRQKHQNNEQLSVFFGGGNLILRTEFLQENSLDFDMRFNTTGGEDTYFGVQALKKNAKVFWAEKAVAYENIPEARANVNWLFKRYFRGGNTYTYILILERKYFLILKKILVSVLNSFFGFFLLVLIPFPIKNRYYGLLKLLAPSLGSFAAIFNIKFHEYAHNK